MTEIANITSDSSLLPFLPLLLILVFLTIDLFNREDVIEKRVRQESQFELDLLRWDLSGLDVSSANLEKCDLRTANLEELN